MLGRTIVVTSGKGGVGKTTVTANLGMSLAKRGARVCLIDTDTGLRNLDLVLGLESRITFDLIDVARGECRLEQALIHDRREPNLYFMPTSQRCEKSALTPADLLTVVSALRDRFDFVLVDSPAGIEEGFQTAIAGADQALVVVHPEVSSVRDADRVVRLLEAAGIGKIELVINRLRPEMVARQDMLAVEDIEELIGARAVAALPDDREVLASTNRGEPLVLDSHNRLAAHFERLADGLAGPAFRLVEPPRPQGFVGKLKALFA